MLEKFVLDYIKRNNLIVEGDKILVAVSGGPDSMCLLDILYKLKDILKIDISVAHVNHLIRVDAKDDAEYVKRFCQEKNIKFYLKECNIQEKSKMERIGVEEAGRNARYDFFKEVAKNNSLNKIAIAHNKNDLAETLIMNLLRGSGSQGLKSISNKNGMYIRPLLDIDRCEIEKYCEENELHPRIDSTNFENTYTRNKIRNIIIPYIKKEFNPNIVETLSRLSKIVTEEQEYIEYEVSKCYEKVMLKEENENITISGKEFSKLNVAIKKRLILYIIKKVQGSTKGIEKKHIEDINKLIDNNIGNKFLTPNKNLKVYINRGTVTFKNI